MPASGELDQGKTAASAVDRFRRGRLASGGSLFLAITFGTFWYQFSIVAAGEPVPEGRLLQWGYLPLILLLLPCEAFLAALRIWLICRVLQPGVSYRTCVKAELANIGVAVVTPSQTGGGAAQIYQLNRGGVSLATSFSVSILSFLGTMVVLAVMGVATLTTGSGLIPPLFSSAVAALSVLAGLIVTATMHPDALRRTISGCSRLCRWMRGTGRRLRAWWLGRAGGTSPPRDGMGPLAIRLVDMACTYRGDMAQFFRRGKGVFAGTCVLTGLFLSSRFVMAFLCVRFLGIQDHSLAEIYRKQVALHFVTYLGPTPGCAGIAEAASASIMADILPAGYAPHYNLLWRFSTTYVAAALGLTLLVHAILCDMGRLRRRG